MSTTFLMAGSVEEAVEAMAAGARAVAGGTDLVVGARSGKAPLPESVVAIDRLEDLRGISADGGLRLGALASHADVAAHPLVRERYTALADACSIVGSEATRAQGTIGGNLMNASPAMEVGGPLLCLEAVVTLRSQGGERQIAVDDLLTGPGRTSAQPGELLTAVELPEPPPASGSCYARLEYRRQMEIAVAGATCVLVFEDDRVSRARIALTALAPTVVRVPEAEALLVGTDGGRAAAEAAAQESARAARPITDVRASAAYRQAITAVLVRRVIEAAAARARGEQVRIPASDALYGAAS
jgi:CO/xanthine dehydrogenase FAD-binding subunit